MRQRADVIWALTVGPDRPQGELDSFIVVSNVISLKLKIITAGKLPLGDWLGHYRVTTGGWAFSCLIWGQKITGDSWGIQQ